MTDLRHYELFDPAWGGLTAAQRGRLMRRLADILRRDADTLAVPEGMAGRPAMEREIDRDPTAGHLAIRASCAIGAALSAGARPDATARR